MKFIETKSVPRSLRDAYLGGLIDPQERFLESLVEQGRCWVWQDKAYMIASDNTAVEFYVTPDYESEAAAVFQAGIGASSSNAALVKSFDAMFLRAALSRPATVTTVGQLFRRIADSEFTPVPGLTFHAGMSADIDQIMAFNDGFFEGVAELASYISIGGLFVLKEGADIVGCGIAMPVVKGREDVVDIGMLVAKPYRRRGLGSHIISFLKDHYLQQGIRPICGCDAENTGSRLALMQAGFTNDASIVRVDYQP